MADIFVVRPHPTSWKSIKIKPNISQRRWNSACYKSKRFEISSNFLSQFLEVSPSLSWNGEVNFFVNPMPMSVCLSLHVCPFCVSVVHTWTFIFVYISISLFISAYISKTIYVTILISVLFYRYIYFYGCIYVHFHNCICITCEHIHVSYSCVYKHSWVCLQNSIEKVLNLKLLMSWHW